MNRKISIIICFMVIAPFADIIIVPTGKTLTLMGTTVGPGRYEITASGLIKLDTVEIPKVFASHGIQILIDPADTIMDIDGNTYHTVKIGNQIWTVENIKTTKYNDGTPIPLIADNSDWENCKTPAYSWYNNDEKNNKYGALYNWYAVNIGKLAPEGWRVPDDVSWSTLEQFLIAKGYNRDEPITGIEVAKSLAAKTDWDTRRAFTGTIGFDLTQNNRSSFSALPGGYRNPNGFFNSIGYHGYWWSDTEIDSSTAKLRYLECNGTSLRKSIDVKRCGFSVRLVRN